VPFLDLLTQVLRSILKAIIPSVPGNIPITITLLDILVIAIILYLVLKVVQASKALQLFQGLAIFFVLLLVTLKLSEWFGLLALNWIIRSTLQVLPTTLPILLAILFQPELRKALGSLGQRSVFGKAIDFMESQELTTIVAEIAIAVGHMSSSKIGALIAIERQVGLADYESSAVKIDGEVSSGLIESIFYPGTALHDGGIIIKGNRIMFARCVFPLSVDPNLESDIGTRHRAAMGLSEETDAIVICVSESSGIISLAAAGSLTRYLSQVELEGLLRYMLRARTRMFKPRRVNV